MYGPALSRSAGSLKAGDACLWADLACGSRMSALAVLIGNGIPVGLALTA